MIPSLCNSTLFDLLAVEISHTSNWLLHRIVGKNVGFATAEILDEDDDEDAPLETDFASGARIPAPAPPSGGGMNSTAIEEAMRAQERPLPNPLLPNFWAVLFLAVVFILNALVWFVQRWSIRVRSKVQYESAAALEPGTYAYVTPHLHQGAAAIVPVQYVKMGSTIQRFFMFQRQKYEIDESGTLVTELSMPDNEPLKFYQEHRGYDSADDVKRAQQRYGSNSLHIELPSFKDAFLKQILGPVPVFQFFCASLWLLDEYWNYALFQLFSIGMYESSTVFGKIKNQQALRGMNKVWDGERGICGQGVHGCVPDERQGSTGRGLERGRGQCKLQVIRTFTTSPLFRRLTCR